MQGRLSPLVEGRIQAFPWDFWRQEFPAAEALGLHLMEWTLDQEGVYENPLMAPDGQQEIRTLCKTHSISIPSLTGDCFMQAPFWKAEGSARSALKDDFLAVIEACATVGIKMIVVPLVDNGGLEDRLQEGVLVEFLLSHAGGFQKLGMKIIFESDFPADELARFIDRLPAHTFGVNYDIGNSAALGYSPDQEFAAYGHRIVNVHVKDRLLGGTTVALGTGNADFPRVFRLLRDIAYGGNLIMQTARAKDEGHVGALQHYKLQIETWLTEAV